MKIMTVLEVFFNEISTGDFEELISEELLDKMETEHEHLFNHDTGHLKTRVKKDLQQYLSENPFLAKEIRNVIRIAFEEYCEGSKYGLPRKKNGKKSKII